MATNQPKKIVARLTLGDNERWDLTEEDARHIGIIQTYLEENVERKAILPFPLDGNSRIQAEKVTRILELLRSPNPDEDILGTKLRDVVEMMIIADFLAMNGCDDTGKKEEGRKDILGVCAKYIANQIRGKTEEEIRPLFEE